MAIDPYIARGITPIGEGIGQTMLAIEQMRRQRSYEQEASRRNDLLEKTQQYNQERQKKADTEADTEKQNKHLLTKVAWALDGYDEREKDPVKVAAMAKAVQDKLMGDEQAKQAIPGLGTMTPEDLVKGFIKERARLSSELGIQPAGRLEAQRVGHGEVITQGGDPKYYNADPDPRQPREEDQVEKYGRDPKYRAAYDKMHPKSGDDEDGAFKAADTNAIRGLVTSAYGGVFDPTTGNITGLNPDDSRNVTRITAIASRAMQANKRLSHGAAVELAMNEYKKALTEAQDRRKKGGATAAPRGTTAAPAAAPVKTARPPKRVDLQSQDAAQAAVDDGTLQVGDTVYINGKPAFTVQQ